MKRMIPAALVVSVFGAMAATSLMAQAAAPKPGVAKGTAAKGAAKAAPKAAGVKTAGAAKTAAAKAAPTAAEMTDDQKALFALGTSMGEQAGSIVKPLQLDAAEIAAFKKGMAAGIDGIKSPYAFEQYQQRLSARAKANMAKLSGANKEKGAAFQQTAAAEPGASKTASGLVFKSLQPGQGASPKTTDVVRVNYRGTLVDGTEFDASQGGPASIALNAVIPCWTEGMQMMKVGEKARLVCPPEIAYGERGQGRIPAGSTLVFDVELVGIAEPPAPKPPAPKPPTP